MWASLVAQMVKNLPARRETWVQSLLWENPLRKGIATHSGILAWAQTLINLAMFGISVQPLFPESRPCSDVSVT